MPGYVSPLKVPKTLEFQRLEGSTASSLEGIMQEITQVLTAFGKRRYATRKEFLSQMLSTLR